MHIRAYDAARDARGVRAAFIELQDYERSLDPNMPPGAEIVDRYLEHLFAQCDEYGGGLLVAEDPESGAVAGYAAVFLNVPCTEPDDDPSPYAYLSDLVVCAAFRGRGLGPRLVAAVEDAARSAGVGRLRLSVLALNAGARRLYSELGFRDHILQMEKPL